MSNATARKINRALWSAQVVAALLFLFAGAMKFVMSVEQMQQGPIVLPVTFIRFIGICEILGGLGLLLPGALRTRTLLTPLAAVGLTVIMIGAVLLSVRGMGPAAGVFPAIVGAVTAWIAYGRAKLVPLSDAQRRSMRTA